MIQKVTAVDPSKLKNQSTMGQTPRMRKSMSIAPELPNGWRLKNYQPDNDNVSESSSRQDLATEYQNALKGKPNGHKL